MPSRIIYQHIHSLMLRQHLLERVVPRWPARHIEVDGRASPPEFACELHGSLRVLVDGKPDEIICGLIEECSRDGLSEPAVGASHNDNSHWWLPTTKCAPIAC